MAKEKKVFVLDTNVIMHDHTCIHKFQEHDVVIPMTVLEELDTYKKHSDARGFNVREFHRQLDEFRKVRITQEVNTGKGGKGKEKKEVSALFNGGVSLGENMGKIHIKTFPRKLHSRVKDIFHEEKGDHRILSAVCHVIDKNQDKKVILVSKDINLRLKAEGINMEAQDYENDKVANVDELYTGKKEVKNENLSGLISDLYKENIEKGVELTEEHLKLLPEDKQPNMCFILSTDNRSVLARLNPTMKKMYRVEKMQPISGITPRNAEQTFAINLMLQDDIKLISLFGIAGTGKTLLAIAVGLHLLKQGKCDMLVLAAATVPLSNKDIGALPGDLKEKVAPFMQGLYDNLDLIKSLHRGKKGNPVDVKPEAKQKKKKSPQKAEPEIKDDFVSILIDEGKLKIQPLAAIRGRSLNNIVFIIDETQNLTPHEMKTIVTRAGENTKIILCGDAGQIDTPYLDSRSNGLSYVVFKMVGQPLFAHIKLEKGERSELAEIAANVL